MEIEKRKRKKGSNKVQWNCEVVKKLERKSLGKWTKRRKSNNWEILGGKTMARRPSNCEGFRDGRKEMTWVKRTNRFLLQNIFI